MQRGTSQKEVKNKIGEDLMKRYDELNQKLMTMMQAGPEYEKTIAEMRRIDMRLSNSDPEAYNYMRLEKEENRKQKEKYKQDKMKEMKETEKTQEQEYEISKQKFHEAMKNYRDLKKSQTTDLNSIYSSPEPIFNPADSMSYLNPFNFILCFCPSLILI